MSLCDSHSTRIPGSFGGIDGEDVAAVVFGVDSVAFDELECDLVFAQQFIQLLPVFDIANPEAMSASCPAFRCPSDGKPEGRKPGKHHYVSGFHGGLELYRGHATRIQESWVKESLNRYGLIIVEGMNDVMRLDDLQVAAVGLDSNKVTAEQLEKLTRFARQLANNRTLLMPDCNEEGESCLKDLLWKLDEAQVNVRLGPTSKSHNGQFA